MEQLELPLGRTNVGDIATVIGNASITPTTLATAVDKLNQVAAYIKSLQESARNRMLNLVMERGEVRTDKGTRVLTDGEWTLEVRPTRTGIDSRKLERLLRAKGQNIEGWMTPKITYEYNPGMAAEAIARGVLTEDELATCKYDESWSVQPPRRETNHE